MAKRLSYSFEEHKKRNKQIRAALLIVAVFFVLYVCLTSFLFSMRSVQSIGMMPGIREKDHFIFSSTQFYKPNLKRGDIVLADMEGGDGPGIFMQFVNGFVRFWTFQRVGIYDGKKLEYLKRVVALPGDEVSMTNFIVRVKMKDSPYWLTEFDSTEAYYEVVIPQVPALWDDSLPFSGNIPVFTLGKDEYFLLSDDRSNTNDSRTWGAVPEGRIAGKALFRYWPVTRIGAP